MKYKPTFDPLADTRNIKLLDELCVWITSNLDSDIGWEQLIAQSKLNHKDLQYLFEKYKQTTPMTYLRKLRQASNKKHIVLDKMRINPIFITKENEWLANTTNHFRIVCIKKPYRNFLSAQSPFR